MRHWKLKQYNIYAHAIMFTLQCRVVVHLGCEIFFFDLIDPKWHWTKTIMIEYLKPYFSSSNLRALTDRWGEGIVCGKFWMLTMLLYQWYNVTVITWMLCWISVWPDIRHPPCKQVTVNIEYARSNAMPTNMNQYANMRSHFF